MESLDCPVCGRTAMTWLQKAGLWFAPARPCASCATPVSGREGVAGRLLFTILENAAFFGGAVAALWMASWVPFVFGALLSLVVLPGLLSSRSPLVAVSPDAVRRSARLRLVGAGLVLLVTIALGLIFS